MAGVAVAVDSDADRSDLVRGADLVVPGVEGTVEALRMLALAA